MAAIANSQVKGLVWFDGTASGTFVGTGFMFGKVPHARQEIMSDTSPQQSYSEFDIHPINFLATVEFTVPQSSWPSGSSSFRNDRASTS
jgi:hypothetical protein